MATNATEQTAHHHRYSSKLSSKTSLIKETVQVMSALAPTGNLEQARAQVIDDNLLLKQTIATRETTWEIIYNRYFSGNSGQKIQTLASFVASTLPERDRHLVLFYELAKALPLVYDLTVDCLYGLYQDGRSSLDKADVLAWLDRAAANGHPEVGDWSPQTKGKVASNYLTIARDFGLLEGKQRKHFTRLYLPLPTFVYILYRLKDDNQPTKAIVTSPDFKLFLLGQRDVFMLLDEATRAGYITFQQAGDIYHLNFHCRDLAEVVDELIGQV